MFRDQLSFFKRGEDESTAAIRTIRMIWGPRLLESAAFLTAKDRKSTQTKKRLLGKAGVFLGFSGSG